MRRYGLQLYYIEWVDSKATAVSWEFRAELQPLYADVCCTVGWLLEETEEYKTIVPTISETQVLGRLTIPIASIRVCQRVEWDLHA